MPSPDAPPRACPSSFPRRRESAVAPRPGRTAPHGKDDVRRTLAVFVPLQTLPDGRPAAPPALEHGFADGHREPPFSPCLAILALHRRWAPVTRPPPLDEIHALTPGASPTPGRDLCKATQGILSPPFFAKSGPPLAIPSSPTSITYSEPLRARLPQHSPAKEETR